MLPHVDAAARADLVARHGTRCTEPGGWRTSSREQLPVKFHQDRLFKAGDRNGGAARTA